MTLTTVFGTPGRPGVFLAPARAPDQLRTERLDVAGFVGVALRGPVDEPVRVTRWSDFVRVFGGLEPAPGGPVRLLPYAVSAFFRQGGQVAYVLRVAPHGSGAVAAADATATFRLRLPTSGQEVLLRAADEGAWGNALRVRLLYQPDQRTEGVLEAADVLRLPPGTSLTAGSLLRLSDGARPAAVALRWVARVDDRLPRGSRLHVRLDRGLPLAVGSRVATEVVTGTLEVEDPASSGTRERLTGLGLRPEHPRWLLTLLTTDAHPADSSGSGPGGRHLVVPANEWAGVDLTPRPDLSPVVGELVAEVADRSHLIDDESFFALGPVGSAPIDEDLPPDARDPHVGVDRMARVRAIGLLCVPDLTWRRYTPAPPPPRSDPGTRPTRCCSVCDRQAPESPDHPVAPPVGGLDARDPDDLERIIARQERLVATAQAHERFVALLDVPDGLSVAQVTRWRARFDSSYAAAYHPWLAVVHDAGDRAVGVPPSAFAAGIIAEREVRLGLPWGPANELARDAVRAESAVNDAIHDRLHALGVNVFRAERDGFRLTAGRTLSSDPDYRQLSVRRLVTMMRLSLDRLGQDLAFEPNNAELRERLAWLLTSFLRGLARRGAFAGRTDAESFFVRCGDDVNPPASQALGRLVAEVGVAPAVPLEYILVRIARDPDGTLSVVRGD